MFDSPSDIGQKKAGMQPAFFIVYRLYRKAPRWEREAPAEGQSARESVANPAVGGASAAPGYSVSDMVMLKF